MGNYLSVFDTYRCEEFQNGLLFNLSTIATQSSEKRRKRKNEREKSSLLTLKPQPFKRQTWTCSLRYTPLNQIGSHRFKKMPVWDFQDEYPRVHALAFVFALTEHFHSVLGTLRWVVLDIHNKCPILCDRTIYLLLDLVLVVWCPCVVLPLGHLLSSYRHKKLITP